MIDHIDTDQQKRELDVPTEIAELLPLCPDVETAEELHANGFDVAELRSRHIRPFSGSIVVASITCLVGKPAAEYVAAQCDERFYFTKETA